MLRRHPTVVGMLAPVLLALVAGCTGGAPTAVPGESDVTRAVLPGLEQRVTLTPSELVAGENVQIQSVITNRGSDAVQLESRICGLDLGGDLELSFPPGFGVCAGYSMEGTIAPGESRAGSELQRVDSKPGTYTLRVRHALRPELWVEMRVVVRAR
jgi:hypothetical protein